MKDIIPNNLVLAAVTEVGNGFKARIKEQIATRYRNRIADYQKKCEENPGKTSPSTFWPADGCSSNYWYNKAIQGDVRMFLDSVSRPVSEYINEPGPFHKREQLRYSVKPEAEIAAIIERQSEKQAEDAIQGFIAKMTAKLQGILDSKGDFTKVEVSGSLGQNYMVFHFTDGSRFSVTNDIFQDFSCKGRPYNQYPTRFTGVVLQGNHVKNACSEAAVKKLFVKAA